jgi:hypothetical protein
MTGHVFDTPNMTSHVFDTPNMTGVIHVL